MNRKEWALPAVVMLLILPILVSCKKHTASWRGTIKEVDGMTIVTNPRSPMLEENALSVEETLTIGSKDGGKEYTFAEIADLGVDEEENIYPEFTELASKSRDISNRKNGLERLLRMTYGVQMSP